ncbi:hypothetical protein [Pseudomonas sp. NPDC089734]|uniref:hypothetical protein n=1 Tax=Pseudomonas sp. NPDC089734 TaxID=3364469 RepID=UPI00380A5AB3
MKPVAMLIVLACSGLSISPAANAETSPTASCIETRVGQYRAPDYNCLSQQMLNTQGAAAHRKNMEAMNTSIDKRAPNSLGLATPAATSVRMGNTFGTSVTPQRPPSSD